MRVGDHRINIAAIEMSFLITIALVAAERSAAKLLTEDEARRIAANLLNCLSY